MWGLEAVFQIGIQSLRQNWNPIPKGPIRDHWTKRASSATSEPAFTSAEGRETKNPTWLWFPSSVGRLAAAQDLIKSLQVLAGVTSP